MKRTDRIVMYRYTRLVDAGSWDALADMTSDPSADLFATGWNLRIAMSEVTS